MNEWSRAEAHAEKAHQFFQAGQFDKALAELKAALAVNPNQGDWHLGMGLILDQMRRYDEAIQAYEHALKLRGESTDLLLHLAVDLIRTDRQRRAIDTLTRVGRLDPSCEAAWCYRIAAHAHLDEHDKAEEAFYMARQLSDECPLCYDHIAQSLEARGAYDRAVWCWQQTLRLDPHFPDVYRRLAQAHARRGQFEKAHQYYIQQLRESPGDTDALLQLGNLLVEMGRSAEASEKFRRVLELDPTVADAHLHLGELALAAGHLDAAEAELLMAQRFDPELPGIHLGLAQIAQQRGRCDRAAEQLQAEMDRTDHTPAQTLDIVRTLIELQEPRPAIRLLTTLLEEPPGQARLADDTIAAALLYRGVAFMLLSRTDQGIADCRRALRLAPRNTLAMHNLVLAYMQDRRFRRASFWLHHAIELAPHDPQLRQLRHRLQWSRLTAWFADLRKRLGRRRRRGPRIGRLS